MNFTVNTYDDMVLMLAEGSLVLEDFKRIAAEVEKLSAGKDKYLILDCADLRKLIYHSTGFSGLINQLLALKSYNVGIILYSCDSLLSRLIKMLNLDDAFSICQTLDDAYVHITQNCKVTT